MFIGDKEEIVVNISYLVGYIYDGMEEFRFIKFICIDYIRCGEEISKNIYR